MSLLPHSLPPSHHHRFNLPRLRLRERQATFSPPTYPDLTTTSPGLILVIGLLMVVQTGTKVRVHGFVMHTSPGQ